MSIKEILKSIRWFLAVPLKRLKYIASFPHWRASKSMHWSTELMGRGRIVFHQGTIIGRRSKLQVPNGQELFLGKGAWIGDDCEISVHGRIKIGARTSLQHRTTILGEVNIGAGCVCAPNLYISSSRHHFSDVPAASIRWQDEWADNQSPPAFPAQSVYIGDDCWLGINVVIMPGVRIGRGCIIGANAVVTKSLPDYVVAVGVPAKAVGKRLIFSPPAQLSAKLLEHLPYFYSGFDQYTLPPKRTVDSFDHIGWFAEPQFQLALNVEPGQKILMHISTQGAGQLKHGAAVVEVAAGLTVLQLVASPSEPSILDFEWMPKSANAAEFAVISVAADIG